MTASVQKRTTGEDQNGNAIEVYEFGASIDGTFVPFVTKPAGYIEHLRDARKATEQAEQGTDGEPDTDTATAEQ